MAVEIQIPWTATGDTLYAIIHDDNGALYNGGGFEGYLSSNYLTYAVPLSEIGTSRYYVGGFPPVAAAVYHVAIFRQAGGTPAEGDDPIDRFTIEWTGAGRLQIGALLPAALVDGGIQSSVTELAGSVPSDLANSLLDHADGVETSITLRQALRLILSALAGPISGADTSSVSIKNVAGSKTRIVASVDAAGNRTSVTIDPT